MKFHQRVEKPLIRHSEKADNFSNVVLAYKTRFVAHLSGETRRIRQSRWIRERGSGEAGLALYRFTPIGVCTAGSRSAHNTSMVV